MRCDSTLVSQHCNRTVNCVTASPHFSGEDFVHFTFSLFFFFNVVTTASSDLRGLEEALVSQAPLPLPLPHWAELCAPVPLCPSSQRGCLSAFGLLLCFVTVHSALGSSHSPRFDKKKKKNSLHFGSDFSEPLKN